MITHCYALLGITKKYAKLLKIKKNQRKLLRIGMNYFDLLGFWRVLEGSCKYPFELPRVPGDTSKGLATNYEVLRIGKN